MVELSKIREQEQRLSQKLKAAESELKRKQRQLADALRRDDTRRKIVLGGALLKAMDSGAIPQEVGRKLVGRFVADRDQKLFEGSPLAVSAAGSETASSEVSDSDLRE